MLALVIHLPWVACFYAAMSVATFIVYALDKSSARGARRRVPEKTLHLLSLLGGFPGALIAQRVLRHKTRKVAFQVITWAIVAGHVAFWGWRLGYVGL